MRETKHGAAIAIKDARGLHEAIALNIIGSPRRLRGQEVRFLRAQLKLSQEGLAKVLQTKRGSVARWEAEPAKAIPGLADSALRLFYAFTAQGHETARRLVDLLRELDELEHQAPATRETTFGETEGVWRPVPLAA